MGVKKSASLYIKPTNLCFHAASDAMCRAFESHQAYQKLPLPRKPRQGEFLVSPADENAQCVGEAVESHQAYQKLPPPRKPRQGEFWFRLPMRTHNA